MYFKDHSDIGFNKYPGEEEDGFTFKPHPLSNKTIALGLSLFIIALPRLSLGVSWAKGKPTSHSILLSLPGNAYKVIILGTKGNPMMVLEDRDHDGFFEIRETFKQGKPYRLEEDRNHDGRPDRIISYNEKGETTKMILDRNNDGEPDKWQFYRDGRIASAEEDSNFDGKIDYRIRFDRMHRPVLILEDTDHDGCFETRQEFGNRDWDRKVSIESCSKGITKGISYYKGKKMIKRLWDKDGDGVMDTEEYFRKNGTRCVLCQLKKVGKGARDKCNPLFLYDKTGKKTVKAAKDIDSDGLYDLEYDFTSGIWSRIPKDQENLWKPDSLCKGPY